MMMDVCRGLLVLVNFNGTVIPEIPYFALEMFLGVSRLLFVGTISGQWFCF